MTDTIQNISQSLRVDIATLYAISNNVANASTPGFRAERPVASFQSHLGGTGQPVALDLKDGPLSTTGNPLDVALRGTGFFQVAHGDQTLLTRAGHFRLDADGRLVDANGDEVLATSGSLRLTDSKVRIDSTGEIWAGDKSLGTLSIVDVADPAGLQVVDGGYRYDGDLAEWKGSVQQGAIEHSNVDVAAESIRLMELTRHVESVQHAISIYDHAMDTGINRLGE
jgi:flagellar basal-body rod protein FlgF/flagellar basal-body rod protein FlgG